MACQAIHLQIDILRRSNNILLDKIYATQNIIEFKYQKI